MYKMYVKECDFSAKLQNKSSEYMSGIIIMVPGHSESLHTFHLSFVQVKRKNPFYNTYI